MTKKTQSINVLKKVVADGLIICCLALCIYAAKLFPIFVRGFFCDDESLRLPYKTDTVTDSMLKGFGLAIPITLIVICEWALLHKEPANELVFGCEAPVWIRGAYNGLISFGIGMCFGEIVVNVGKKSIGRLRPHFFDVCQPSIDCSSPEWQNRYVLPDEYECLGNDTAAIYDMRQSFPSGHSCWSAYTMLFIALYLERRMSWSNCTRYFRHCLQFVALMLCWFTGLSRVTDHKHHWSDVLSGFALGWLLAIAMIVWGTDYIQPGQKSTEDFHQHQHQLDVEISHQHQPNKPSPNNV